MPLPDTPAMRQRIVKGLTAAFVAATLLVGPALAGSGPVASARGICQMHHGHCVHH